MKKKEEEGASGNTKVSERAMESEENANASWDFV